MRTENILFRFFDAPLSDAEKEQVTVLLKNDRSLNEEYQSMLAMRGLIAGTKTESFNAMFVQRVMERIQSMRQEYFISLERDFRRLAFAAVLLALLLGYYNSTRQDSFSVSSIFAHPDQGAEVIVQLEEPLK